MASKNAKAVLASYDAFNKRDLAGVVQPMAPEVEWLEQPTGQTYKGVGEFKTWVQTLQASSSDLKIADTKVFEAGDTIITTFTMSGTNDGPLGPLPATGKYASVPGCDVTFFDAKGRIIGGETYYDNLSLMTQLGHIPPMM